MKPRFQQLFMDSTSCQTMSFRGFLLSFTLHILLIYRANVFCSDAARRPSLTLLAFYTVLYIFMNATSNKAK